MPATGNPIKSFNIPAIALSALMLAIPAFTQAQIVALDKGQTLNEPRTGWLPYIFGTESLGTAIGVGGGISGKLQPQSSMFGTGFATSNGSSLVAGSINNIQLGNSRFFTDGFLMLDHFTDQRFYGDLDNDPSQARAGSNDSDENDYLTGVSDEVTINIALRYLLPIGANASDPVSVYRLDDGLVQPGSPVGGKTWNPMTSGRTTLASKFFYTYRDLSEYDGNADQVEARTNGLDFWLEYENTDFPRNPSYGSRQQLKVSRDFGWFDSSNSWTNVELDMTKYYSLGISNWFKHKALALNFWTSNTTSWKSNEGTLEAGNRPPPNFGSELGGYDRMRAYPTGRFRDKSAAYYSAEVRLTPQFQKMRDWPIIKYFEVDWFQVVPFVEAGRVSSDYDFDLFTKDLKYDAGIGLRAMAFRTVFRLDFAYSEEGGSVYAMISQPFTRPGN